MHSDRFDLRTLSLGAGVQSTGMYLMALDGLFPVMPDVAIFADTQQEPPWVYENLWQLAEEGGDKIPIIVGTAGDIGEHVMARGGGRDGHFASVPFWIKTDAGSAGLGRRQCTSEFKIQVIKKVTRGLLGLRPRQRAAGRFRVEEWVGISIDEASRAKPSRESWIHTRWPLLFDLPKRRGEIKEWLKGRGWPVPQKSSCIFCPFRNPSEYARWRTEEPELFEVACRYDDAARSMRGSHMKQYVLKTLSPLRDIPDAGTFAKGDKNQINLFENECEGMCGV